MAEDAPDKKPAESPDGVFGNLPGTRPGPRSPRRRSSADQPAPEPSRRPRRTPPPPPPPPEPPPAPPPGAERETPVAAPGGSGQRIASVEDLAWAGVAVAAQAATVGVRFASRALEAARKSVDRP